MSKKPKVFNVVVRNCDGDVTDSVYFTTWKAAEKFSRNVRLSHHVSIHEHPVFNSKEVDIFNLQANYERLN